ATVLNGKTEQGPSMIRGLLDFAGRKMFLSTMEDGLDALGEIIKGETADSSFLQRTIVKVPADQIENALTESLAEM
ncbi:MAG TPA: hypothetical protein VMW34_01890, partial [Anaerolineales bacterium]|nr:hypothetical protein [Anaerolineales bacterium]